MSIHRLHVLRGTTTVGTFAVAFFSHVFVLFPSGRVCPRPLPVSSSGRYFSYSMAQPIPALRFSQTDYIKGVCVIKAIFEGIVQDAVAVCFRSTRNRNERDPGWC